MSGSQRRLAVVLLALVVSSCTTPPGADPPVGDDPPPAVAPARADEPHEVVVQHVLISHRAAGIPGVTRTDQEAARLAADVLLRARRGESFDRLVRLYSDEHHDRGIYRLTNFGVPVTEAGQRQRVEVARDFGDMAFRLRPLEIGFVDYDTVRSPFGRHIVKRLR